MVAEQNATRLANIYSTLKQIDIFYKIHRFARRIRGDNYAAARLAMGGDRRNRIDAYEFRLRD